MSSCPICGEAPAARFKPFCSRRCADVDLGRWLNGAYAVAAEEEDRPDDAQLAPIGDGDGDGDGAGGDRVVRTTSPPRRL